MYVDASDQSPKNWVIGFSLPARQVLASNGQATTQYHDAAMTFDSELAAADFIEANIVRLSKVGSVPIPRRR